MDCVNSTSLQFINFINLSQVSARDPATAPSRIVSPTVILPSPVVPTLVPCPWRPDIHGTQWGRRRRRRGTQRRRWCQPPRRSSLMLCAPHRAWYHPVDQVSTALVLAPLMHRAEPCPCHLLVVTAPVPLADVPRAVRCSRSVVVIIHSVRGGSSMPDGLEVWACRDRALVHHAAGVAAVTLPAAGSDPADMVLAPPPALEGPGVAVALATPGMEVWQSWSAQGQGKLQLSGITAWSNSRSSHAPRTTPPSIRRKRPQLSTGHTRCLLQ